MAKPKPVGKPTVTLVPNDRDDLAGDNPGFVLRLKAIPQGTPVEVTLCEMDETADGTRRPDRELGKFKGKTARSSTGGPSSLTLALDAQLPTENEVRAAIREDNKSAGKQPRPILVSVTVNQPDGDAIGFFRLDDQEADKLEGDYWEVRARLTCTVAGSTATAISPVYRVARLRRGVPVAIPVGTKSAKMASTSTATSTTSNSPSAARGPASASSYSTSRATSVDKSTPQSQPGTSPRSDRSTSTATGTSEPSSSTPEQGSSATSLSTSTDTSADPPVRLATHPVRTGNVLKFYNDGCDDPLGTTGAFADMLDAIDKAEHFIFVADWSFHPLFRPSRVGPNQVASIANCIGETLIRKAEAGVVVAIHTWDHTNLGSADKQNDHGRSILEKLAAMVATAARLPRPKADPTEIVSNLFWRMSSRPGAIDSLVYSHHQKFLVTDFKTKSGKSGIRAFIGGLDLTKGRFDHHGHPVGPSPNPGMEPEHEPKIPGDGNTWAYAQKWSLGEWQADEWYNSETKDDRRLPRQPWHDVHARLDGPSAWDYLREFVGRWLSKDGAARTESPIWKTYLSLLDQDKFVPIDQPYEGGTWCVQVCRSLEKAHWSVAMPRQTLEALKKQHHWSDAYGFQWPLGAANCEQSILQAYDQAIDQAEEFIYIENQYFLGSGDKWGAPEIKNDIPERIVNRILERSAAKVPFHVYIVMPMFPEGEPASNPLRKLRRFEYETFKWMVGELDKTIGEKWSDYLSLYFLANWQQVLPSARWTPISNSADQNRFYALKHHQRYMIYVHTKVMIVDDRYLILGSCNLNDRGLMGNGDSEIVISAWPMLDAQKRDTCIKDIRKLRLDLWKEHLAPSPLPAMHLQPGNPSCVNDIKTRAFKNHKAFREMTRGPTDGHLCLWNYELRKGDLVLLEVDDGLGMVAKWKSPEEVMCLPDSPFPKNEQAKSEGWTWRGDTSWIPSFIVD